MRVIRARSMDEGDNDEGQWDEGDKGDVGIGMRVISARANGMVIRRSQARCNDSDIQEWMRCVIARWDVSDMVIR